ncbi:CRISPR system precrRNA processing endoribonuclease RAMP protein Cas6 [Sulfolobus tengchongensis]|uniref:CRISPR system precrRNA processing endoribonuclease RAMP protein Cas6 n=1 Tax=Sulfolobus tengchongensis TaxID=207809 RepID=A0AAX4L1T3_9CREN
MPYSLHRLKINVSDFITADYTGKFVKAVLVNANPEFEQVFENPSYPTPKPIRITPLLRGDDKFPSEAIYPKSFTKPNGKISISIGGDYYFLVGLRDDLYQQFISALGRLFSGISFKYGEFDVKVKAIGYEQIPVDYPLNYNSLIVKFISPTVFNDPFARLAGLKQYKLKRFTPIPPFIFSVNVYEMLREKYKRSIVRLGYAFFESHDNLENVKRIWYYYNGNWLPGIIGYAKFIRREKVPREALEDFVKIFNHAQIMGVGTGRGAGFGYAIIEVKSD